MRPTSAAARPSRPVATVRPPVSSGPPPRATPASTARTIAPSSAKPNSSAAPPSAPPSSSPSFTASAGAPGTSKPPAAPAPKRAAAAPAPGEQKILFQKFFKSVGPRTYAAQVKEANNGNHFLVVTEGKRDDATGEVRKTRLFVFSEDFVEFFNLLDETVRFIKAHPVPAEVEQRRRRFWAKKNAPGAPPAPAAASK